MSRYLLAWDLSGQHVLVVGAGTVGEAKVETLRTTGARIVVVGPAATSRLRELHRDGTIELRERRVRLTDVLGARLVVAATDDSRCNQRVRRWAHVVRAVVNVVDDPALCDVTVPASLRRGPATIAISTDGASPATARFLREEIERAVPPTVSDLVEHAAAARRSLRDDRRYRYDYPAWRQRLLEPGLDAVRAGRLSSLRELRHRFEHDFAAPTPIRPGKVTLVGAGPGGTDLITIRGARALAGADVVVYDRLADASLLDLAPSTAERIPVGKHKGCGVPQDQINDILVAKASAGLDVVRLKGGDPFIFGRGSEECAAVTAAGLNCDVVPGVSSALAAPALLGVPLTERGVSASFTVLSGHRIADADHDWDALARSSATLVVLMGASNANLIARSLIDHGRPPTEPVAIVHAAGTSSQRSTFRTLDELATDGCPFPAPCVIVIGPVADANRRQTPPGQVPGTSPNARPSTAPRSIAGGRRSA
jgi:uroporphyrin-III C-methyltransferase